MRVLVIPEDFRKDQFILKPIVEAMLETLGRDRAKVVVCRDPLLGGIGQALKWTKIQEILDRYKMVDVFLLLVDRDGEPERRVALNNLETMAQKLLEAEKCFLAENAWQEVEVWVLAGLDLPKDWNWKAIRRECNPKEVYFEPYVKSRKDCNLLNEPGAGRKSLAHEAARNYSRIRSRCPEDIQSLEERLRNLLNVGKESG